MAELKLCTQTATASISNFQTSSPPMVDDYLELWDAAFHRGMTQMRQGYHRLFYDARDVMFKADPDRWRKENPSEEPLFEKIDEIVTGTAGQIKDILSGPGF